MTKAAGQRSKTPPEPQPEPEPLTVSTETAARITGESHTSFKARWQPDATCFGGWIFRTADGDKIVPNIPSGTFGTRRRVPVAALRQTIDSIKPRTLEAT